MLIFLNVFNYINNCFLELWFRSKRTLHFLVILFVTRWFWLAPDKKVYIFFNGFLESILYLYSLYQLIDNEAAVTSTEMFTSHDLKMIEKWSNIRWLIFARVLLIWHCTQVYRKTIYKRFVNLIHVSHYYFFEANSHETEVWPLTSLRYMSG